MSCVSYGKDEFVNRNDVSFKGTAGGLIGAISGEMLALGITRWFHIGGVLGSVGIFLASIAGVCVLGDFIEEKICQNKQNNNI